MGEGIGFGGYSKRLVADVRVYRHSIHALVSRTLLDSLHIHTILEHRCSQRYCLQQEGVPELFKGSFDVPAGGV